MCQTRTLNYIAPFVPAHIPQVKNSSHGDQGLGWQVNSTPGREVIWHNGQTGGFASYMGIQPDSGTAVVVLCNSNRGVSQAAQIGGHLLFPHVAGAEDIPWMIPTYRPKTPIDFGKYVGRYKTKSGSKFVVENRNGEPFRAFWTNRVSLAIDRSARISSRPSPSTHSFAFSLMPEEVLKALVLEQNGRKTTYTPRTLSLTSPGVSCMADALGEPGCLKSSLCTLSR